MRALFIGQSYIDLTFLADEIPTGDEKTVARRYAVSFGGNAVTAAFALLLAYLLRSSIVASFGRHFTTNRASLLTAIEVPLREASTRFYAALATPLDERIKAHAAERQGHEPLLTRVEQLQQTFAYQPQPGRVLVLAVSDSGIATPDPYFLDLSAGTTDLAWAPGLNAFASVIAGLRTGTDW